MADNIKTTEVRAQVDVDWNQGKEVWELGDGKDKKGKSLDVVAVRPGGAPGQLIVDIYLGKTDKRYNPSRVQFYRLAVNADSTVQKFEHTVFHHGFYDVGVGTLDRGILPKQTGESVFAIARRVSEAVNSSAKEDMKPWFHKP